MNDKKNGFVDPLLMPAKAPKKRKLTGKQVAAIAIGKAKDMKGFKAGVADRVDEIDQEKY